MEVFKNTPASNEILWRLKHLIEVRPLRFASGQEPTSADDASRIVIDPDGTCRMTEEKKTACGSPELGTAAAYTESWADGRLERGRMFPPGYLVSKTM